MRTNDAKIMLSRDAQCNTVRLYDCITRFLYVQIVDEVLG